MPKTSTRLVDSGTIGAVLAIVFCLAAAVAARHDIYEKTPDYALRQIISSAESGDKTDFFEAVHDKDIAYAAFDSLTRRQQGDAVTAILELAGLPARENFASDIHILWEDALTGSNVLDEDGGKAAEAGGILRGFGFSVPLKGWYYDSHSFSKSIAAGKAEITVSLYNDRLKATLPCSIIMEKNADSWQITGFTDDIGFLTAVDKAYKKALDTYNKDAVRQMERFVTIGSVNSFLNKDPASGKTFLCLQYAPSFPKGTANIKDILCRYTLRRNADEAVLYETDLHLPAYKDNAVLTSQFLLNPLIPSHQALLAKDGLDDTTGTLKLMSVLLKDGTAIRCAERLPQ